MGKARDLARVIVDSGGLISANNLGNAVPADGSITNAKIASMAASKLTGQVPDANAPSGSVIQVVSFTTDAQSSITSFSPQTAMSASITPSSSSSKILILIDARFSTGTDVYGMTRIFRNNTEIASSSQLSTGSSNTRGWQPIHHRDGDAWWESEPVAGSYLDSPATTSPITYHLKYECNYGTPIYFNRPYESSNQPYHWNSVSTITLVEISA